MWLKLKICFGYAILVLLLAFIVYQFRKEQVLRHMLRKEEKELAAIHSLAEKSYIGLLDLSTHAEIAITWDDNDLKNYSYKRYGVCDSLQLLKEYVHTPLQKNRIDSLCLLLWNKEILLSKTMHTFNELQSIGDIVQESIPSIILTAGRQAVQQKRNMVLFKSGTRDSSKKGIWDIFPLKENKFACQRQKEDGECRHCSLFIVPSIGMATCMLHSLSLEQAERLVQIQAQMDSLYVGGMELNERMNSIVSEFERENNERFAARYRTFVLERNNSYYVVAGLALSISLLAIVLYILIHRDLNRRLRYEREFEQSDNRNRELLRSRKELMASVAHDLRAPLAAIRGCAEQLSSESDGSCRVGYLDNILHSSDYMLALVDTLMEYHRMDEGGTHSKNTLFSLKTLFEEIADSHRLAALQKDLAFTASFSGLDAIVCCDSSHIRQIVGNLLSNAFKFTPENGKIAVRLSSLNKEDKRWIRFTVANTGSMISAEHIRNVFDRFYKIDMHHAGSGIGLALVKAFVEMHGGTIAVESDEKLGTIFTVELPVQSCETVATEPDDILVSPDFRTTDILLTEEEELVKGYDSSKPSVLVIDDNEDIRSYVHTLLHTDYTVIEAADGSEGIRKAMKYVPDLIISDVMMPGIDGIECCRRLKSELQTCHIPVILLTACSLDEQRIQGYDGGADSYISKPFSSQLLMARVRNLIDSHRRLKQFFGDGQTLAKEDVCDMDKDFVERFKSLIEEKMGDSGLNVEDLGKEMGLSRVQLYRKIKSLTNYSPNELLRIARLKKAASLLASSDMTVAEIGYEVGFSSPSYFTKCYKEQFGESPTDFLKRKG